MSDARSDARLTLVDFQSVTELAGEPISSEQLARICHRYAWAALRCKDKDVVEAACGSGPGLGMLAVISRSLEAGDYSAPILERARAHYGARVALRQFDAADMPFDANSKDVIILFEAIYYLPNAEGFVRECKRVLRPGGEVLIATANKDLSDFNPSPYSYRYFGTIELSRLFEAHGFNTEIFGYFHVSTTSLWQRMLRPLKKLVVAHGLMPKTMVGKRLLKRLVFGRPIPMPAEVLPETGTYTPPEVLSGERPDGLHKVIYCVARFPG